MFIRDQPRSIFKGLGRRDPRFLEFLLLVLTPIYVDGIMVTRIRTLASRFRCDIMLIGWTTFGRQRRNQHYDS